MRSATPSPSVSEVSRTCELQRVSHTHPTLYCNHLHTQAHIHTYIHTQAHIHAILNTSIHPSIHPSMHTYIHTYIHTHIHTYIHYHTHYAEVVLYHIYMCVSHSSSLPSLFPSLLFLQLDQTTWTSVKIWSSSLKIPPSHDVSPSQSSRTKCSRATKPSSWFLAHLKWP